MQEKRKTKTPLASKINGKIYWLIIVLFLGARGL
jgi:hypothetical protein